MKTAEGQHVDEVFVQPRLDIQANGQTSLDAERNAAGDQQWSLSLHLDAFGAPADAAHEIVHHGNLFVRDGQTVRSRAKEPGTAEENLAKKRQNPKQSKGSVENRHVLA